MSSSALVVCFLLSKRKLLRTFGAGHFQFLLPREIALHVGRLTRDKTNRNFQRWRDFLKDNCYTIMLRLERKILLKITFNKQKDFMYTMNNHFPPRGSPLTRAQLSLVHTIA